MSGRAVGRGRAALMAEDPDSDSETPRSRARAHETLPSAVGTGRGKFLASQATTATSSSRDDHRGDDGRVGSKHRSKNKSGSVHDEDFCDEMQKCSMKEQVEQPVIKRGSAGQEEDVITNYLHLETEPGKGAYMYRVEFDPPIDSKGLKMFLLKQHQSKLGVGMVFDIMNLYLPERLPDDVTVVKSTHRDSTVRVKLTYNKMKPFSELPILFNVLFKQIMAEMDLVDFGRKYFDSEAASTIPEFNLEIWPGYVTTVSDFEGGVMLNIDISHRILRSDTILDLLKDSRRQKGDGFVQHFERLIIGNTVLTRYNNKPYRIEEVRYDMSPKSTFDRNGEDITFAEYYKMNYGLKVKDLNQPLLLAKDKENKLSNGLKKEARMLMLIPELCTLTGLSDEMTSNYHLMKQVTNIVSTSPADRFLSIRKFIRNIRKNPKANEILESWGITINPNPSEVEARVLEPETVVFGEIGNDRKQIVARNGDWKNAFMRVPVLNAIHIEDWAILHSPRDLKYTKDLVDQFLKQAPGLGIKARKPNVIALRSDVTDAYVKGLMSVIHPRMDIVVCVCPSMRDDRYAAIKKVCCVEKAVPSQVITSATLSKKNVNKIVQNIILQMNCKLGGSLWTVKMPLKNTMYVGIDTFHSKDRRVKSVTAMVASYNEHLTNWYSSVTIQRPGQEMSDTLKPEFKKALKRYYKANKEYPSKIIIYRDGVGNNQLHMVKNFEVKQFESCLEEIDPSYDPKIVIIVVQKRISTRLYRRSNTGELVSPEPGTVVDHTIVQKYLYDFFLVSHSTARGTVIPTHYVVVKDTSGHSVDQIQKLTYKLCHLYFNCANTIRTPAPCQYAHKLCNLVGENIKEEIDPVLSDRLFYL